MLPGGARPGPWQPLLRGSSQDRARVTCLEGAGNQELARPRFRLMNYECDLENGQRLELSNDGDQTFVSLSSGGEGQRQSQGNGFFTGVWSKNPAVYHLEKAYIVRVETSHGSRFLRVEGNRTTRLYREPELAGASEVELKEFPARRMPSMKPMEPMRPMAPMRPMRPMT